MLVTFSCSLRAIEQSQYSTRVKTIISSPHAFVCPLSCTIRLVRTQSPVLIHGAEAFISLQDRKPLLQSISKIVSRQEET